MSKSNSGSNSSDYVEILSNVRIDFLKTTFSIDLWNENILDSTNWEFGEKFASYLWRNNFRFHFLDAKTTHDIN